MEACHALCPLCFLWVYLTNLSLILLVTSACFLLKRFIHASNLFVFLFSQNTEHYVHIKSAQILLIFRENLENASMVSTFLFV
jgi:hypothetical protein